MGKYEKKRKRGFCKWLWAVCLLVVAILLALFVIPKALYRINQGAAQETPARSAASQLRTEEAPPAAEKESEGSGPQKSVTFPVALDEGKLEIESLFPFSGVNPDAEGQTAAEVAAIVLRNTSGKHLREATVQAILSSGQTRTFIITELPAGAAAMAFSVDNGSLLSGDLCADITAEAVFESTPGNEDIAVSVQGMTVTLTNTSSAALQEIEVYYRDVLNGQYFGGMTNSCKIENLSAGEQVIITADESLIGVIEVVRIAVNDKN